MLGIPLLASAFVGYVVGSWFVVDEAHGYIEAIILPIFAGILIFLLSGLLLGLALGLIKIFQGESPWELMAATIQGVIGAFMFVTYQWKVITLSAALSGLYMYRQSACP
jgi:hypothetical protein